MPTPEEQIARAAPRLLWPVRPCIATDPMVEYAIEMGDPALRGPLITATLETNAAAYRALAEGAEKAARIVAGKAKA